jgi:hypothetical protein
MWDMSGGLYGVTEVINHENTEIQVDFDCFLLPAVEIGDIVDSNGECSGGLFASTSGLERQLPQPQ